MSGSDRIRLQHMLDAAREARRFVEGRCQGDLATDRMLVLALQKELEIIGEAAGKVSPAARKCAPLLPWEDIIGMRHRLIHAYFDVNLEVVWKTVYSDLAGLISELESLLDERK